MKRFRISLLLMFWVMALIAVFFAWIGVRVERQRVESRGRIQELNMMRKFAVDRMSSHPEETTTWQISIRQIDDELAERRRKL